MKMRETLLAVALGVAFQAVAAPQTSQMPPPKQQPQNAPSAATTNPPKSNFRWMAAPPAENKIQRAGNMSSQPWTQIVGWHPGQSQFPTAENHQSQLVLIQFPWGK